MNIAFLDHQTAFNDIIALHDLINEVYEDAEKGFWLSGYQRTDPEALTAHIAKGEIAVAREHGEWIASICIYPAGATRMEFGMLVTDPAFRNRGIGKALVLFAEHIARKKKYSIMQLILLKPQHEKHSGKERLGNWYRSMGYQCEKSGPAGEMLPHLREKMAIACVYELLSKQL